MQKASLGFNINMINKPHNELNAKESHRDSTSQLMKADHPINFSSIVSSNDGEEPDDEHGVHTVLFSATYRHIEHTVKEGESLSQIIIDHQACLPGEDISAAIVRITGLSKVENPNLIEPGDKVIWAQIFSMRQPITDRLNSCNSKN